MHVDFLGAKCLLQEINHPWGTDWMQKRHQVVGAFRDVTTTQPPGQIPLISTDILHAALAIAVGLVHWSVQRGRAGVQPELIDRINIFDIQVNRSWKRIPFPGRTRAPTADHDGRFTNPVFAVKTSLRAESKHMPFSSESP